MSGVDRSRSNASSESGESGNRRGLLHIYSEFQQIARSLLDDEESLPEGFDLNAAASRIAGGVLEDMLHGEDLTEDEGSHIETDSVSSEVCNCTNCRHILWVQEEPLPTFGDTFDYITQGREFPDRQYGSGSRDIWTQGQHPRRELPLPEEYCDCDYDSDEEPEFQLDRALSTGNASYNTYDGRSLVSLRQARHLAGLDTGDIDREITRRIMEDPEAWGRVGELMQELGYIRTAELEGENYELR